MIRNTNGYRLDALLDADTPLEIFRRLVVGSEGTLAFIAEAVIDTLPTPGATCVTWIPLPSIDEAVALVPSLVSLGAEAVELMIAPALTAAAQAFPGNASSTGGRSIRRPPHCWSSLQQRTTRHLTRSKLRHARLSPTPICSILWTSPVTPRRSRLTGGYAKACSGSSAKLRPEGTAARQ